MPFLSKTTSLVGLEVEADSIGAVEVATNGHSALAGYGVMPLGSGVFRDGEVLDPEALAEALKALFIQQKLGKSVRLGLANQRVAVRTLRLPRIEGKDELETAIRFQAQDHIPMPLEQAVLDWQVLDATPEEIETGQMSVVVVAARRDMLDATLRAVRGAGLRPVGIDHSAFGMIRALRGQATTAAGMSEYVDAPAEQPAAVVPAKLLCYMGDVTNLAVARGSDCLFTRVSPFGMEGIVQSLAERKGLTLEHARQWLTHVGLERAPADIDGDPAIVEATRGALAEGVAKLADELRLSLDYYAAQEGAVQVEGAILCGPGTTIPGLGGHIESALGQACDAVTPAALSQLEPAAAARLTISYGLALEG